MKQLLCMLISILAFLTVSNANAKSCDNVNISVGLRVPAGNGYSVRFDPTAVYTKVRGYSTWAAMGDPFSGQTVSSGQSRQLTGKVNYKMKCGLQRSMRVNGTCTLYRDGVGQIAQRGWMMESEIQGKGVNNFGTLTACAGLVPKQCVLNDAGFIMGVQWYRPDQLVVAQTGETTMELRQNATPFQTAAPTLGVRNCVDGTDNVALLSINNAKLANDITKGAIVGAMTVGSGIACAAVAGATAGVGASTCTAVVKVAAGASVLITTKLPKEHKVFALLQPNNKNITKVIGTIWQPAIREGNPVPY